MEIWIWLKCGNEFLGIKIGEEGVLRHSRGCPEIEESSEKGSCDAQLMRAIF